MMVRPAANAPLCAAGTVSHVTNASIDVCGAGARRRGDRAARLTRRRDHAGTTAVASISTFARSSTSPATTTTDIGG